MKRFFVVLLFFGLVMASFAQTLKAMEFKNQKITDILMVLAEVSGKSIIPDETVTGSASYFFNEIDFDDALKAFLHSYKLYLTQEDGFYFISRIYTHFDPKSGKATLKGDNVQIAYLIRALSKAIGKTILYDTLPSDTLTVQVEDAPVDSILKILIRRFPDYTLEVDKDFYYVRRVPQQDMGGGASVLAQTGLIVRKGDLYSIHVKKARFRQLIAELFKQGEKEYSQLIRSDSIIEDLNIEDKSFEEILKLILLQANGDFTVKKGIYYIFEGQRRDLMKQFQTTVLIPLNYIMVQQLVRLMPPELATGNLYKLDDTTNSIILSGTVMEISPIIAFIADVDKPMGTKKYYRIELKYLKVQEISQFLPPDMMGLKFITLPKSNSFVMLLSKGKKAQLDDYLAMVDTVQPAYPIQLKYIKSEEFLGNLPPSVTPEQIVKTPGVSTVFFKGSEEQRADLLRDLKVLDKPVPQVRYDLLVIQYLENKSLSWDTNSEAALADGASSTAFLGSIGNLLSLNFDIVSNFGYQFALNLSTQLSTKSAKVLADTTLHGLSGQKLSFRNTSTYRYIQTEVDPDTGEQKSTGKTTEISSGLIIDISGWVSGDDFITMEIASTVSKNEGASSSDSTTLPTTSEKVINTSVRTKTGTPVVIGGLIQEDRTTDVKKIPILGDIPLLGLLFQSRSEKVSVTEMVIYIVPHLIEEAESLQNLDTKMESVYEKYIRKY